MLSKQGDGDVSPNQISHQIAILNQTYQGRDVDGAGVNTGVGFVLAGTNRIVNDKWHLDQQSKNYRAQTRQGGKNALNIWLVDFDDLGIATSPWDYKAAPGIDGIRVNFDSLPDGQITTTTTARRPLTRPVTGSGSTTPSRAAARLRVTRS